jgi:nicotinate-nucleotide--dimethylbenzimidazole phosphoribosyltransferase
MNNRWRLPEPDADALRVARARQIRLTKPSGSLGTLEDVAEKLAAWQGNDHPAARPAGVLVFAADHPVTRHGVSAYPASVTRAMLDNFVRGGAAASVLCRTLALPLHVIDVGVASPGPDAPGAAARLVRDPVADEPAGDIRVEDAMSEATYDRALAAGERAFDALGPDVRVLLLGDMGIGNTTVAAAVCAAILGGDPASYVGAGTGVDGPALAAKRRVVADAVARLGEGSRSTAEILRRSGGRELVALVGAMARALERRAVVIVDGFIVTAAALALSRCVPTALAGMIFSHCSQEQAHKRVLDALGARPLLALDLRLGEASGALLAYPLIELACALHNEMATFENAGVPERTQ